MQTGERSDMSDDCDVSGDEDEEDDVEDRLAAGDEERLYPFDLGRGPW